MKAQTAKEITSIIGWLVLGASAVHLKLLVAGATLSAYGASPLLLAFSWALFALATGTAIALIQKARIGYYLLYLAALVSLIGPRVNFVPFIHRWMPTGPESDYYMMALNVVVALLVARCHLIVAREMEDVTAGKRERSVALAFVALLAVGLVYWKTGIRTGNGEVARISETPFVGKYLAPLESSQPILYRSIEFPRKENGTVVFRGYTTEENVKEFAAAHDLKLMTNAQARVKFLPITKTWKLDAERFPVFNTANDLCYVGRLPKGSKLVFQICQRPSDGRFTAMAMGSPTARSASAAAVEKE